MNEEIKKEFLYQFTANPEWYDNPDIDAFWQYGKVSAREAWEWIDQKLKEQYLQGAVDMAEAVKIEDIGVAEGQEEKMRYAGGFNDAISKMDKQAQQFIDSLERKEDEH